MTAPTKRLCSMVMVRGRDVALKDMVMENGLKIRMRGLEPPGEEWKDLGDDERSDDGGDPTPG